MSWARGYSNTIVEMYMDRTIFCLDAEKQQTAGLDRPHFHRCIFHYLEMVSTWCCGMYFARDKIEKKGGDITGFIEAEPTHAIDSNCVVKQRGSIIVLRRSTNNKETLKELRKVFDIDDKVEKSEGTLRYPWEKENEKRRNMCKSNFRIINKQAHFHTPFAQFPYVTVAGRHAEPELLDIAAREISAHENVEGQFDVYLFSLNSPHSIGTKTEGPLPLHRGLTYPESHDALDVTPGKKDYRCTDYILKWVKSWENDRDNEEFNAVGWTKRKKEGLFYYCISPNKINYEVSQPQYHHTF